MPGGPGGGRASGQGELAAPRINEKNLYFVLVLVYNGFN